MRDLTYSFDGKEEIAFPALNISRGEHWLITGKSGSGKTTLLHLLAGFRRPLKGEIVIGNTSLHKLSQKQLDKFRGAHMGFVFQTAHFVQSLSVIENLSLAAFLAGKKADTSRNIALLDRLGLEGKHHKKPHDLSVGEQQRAAIARAMVNRPALVLADEPTASLDDENCRVMLELLRNECSASDSTLLIVTHDQRIKDLIHHVVTL